MKFTELPINTLVIIAIAVIVLLVIVVGIIIPAKSGGDETNRRTDFTLLCNNWTANGCGENYYYENEGKIMQTIKCESLGTCKEKCQKAGFC